MLSQVFRLLLFSALIGLCACGGGFGKLQRSKNLDEKLTAAINLYDKKDYYKAGTLLDEITPLLKGKEGAEKAQYYQAWVAFQERDYLLAAYYFKDFYTTFIRSQYAEEAMFMHGKCLYKDAPRANLDQTSSYDALDAMDKFMYRHPYSKYQEETQTMIVELENRLERKNWDNASIYAKIGEHKAAIIALRNFIRDYPTSKHSEKAMFMIVEEQYYLAKKSIHGSKQLERYKLVIDYYKDFAVVYPHSNYQKQAETIKKQSEGDIAELEEYLKYLELNRDYEYAKSSMGSYKMKKYRELIKETDAFTAKYPHSHYHRQVKRIKEGSVKALETVSK